jgi:radical SAM superfamily enzyme YgiQ (UPF0313 family)
VLGGEFEEGLAALAQRLERGVEVAPGEQLEPRVSVARQDFVIPHCEGLPSLDRYAYLWLPNGDRRIAGYVEASRGCKHLCRHCPVVPVYNGRFCIIPLEIVLGDVRQLPEVRALVGALDEAALVYKVRSGRAGSTQRTVVLLRGTDRGAVRH